MDSLQNAPLFEGLGENEIERALACLQPTMRVFEKGQTILMAGTTLHEFGLIRRGAVHIIRVDFWGNIDLLQTVGAGDVFGESYACLPSSPLPVSVVAEQKSEVLFLNAAHVLTVCPSACAFHTRLLRNLVGVLAQKNMRLTRKIDHVTQKSTRRKVLAFLSDEAARHGCDTFTIALDRRALAEYLAVDRSALSAELSHMQRDGLIAFERNRFTLKKG